MALADPWRPAISYELNGTCALRKRLVFPHYPAVPRGCIGRMVALQPNGNIVARFQPIAGDRVLHVSCKPTMLEAYPNLYTRAFEYWSHRPMALQGVGMIVTDIAFPVPRQQAYARFQGNVGRLQDHRNLGITIYDRIDATTVLESFRRVHYKSSDELNIGMVTVEAIWPWRDNDQHRYETGAEMTLRVARSLMAQFASTPVVLLCRPQDAFLIKRECAHVRRFQFLKCPHFFLHYIPLQMHWNQMQTVPVEGQNWEYLYIHPIGQRRALPDPFWLPAEILKLQFAGKRTLSLAAGTCESQVAIAAYISCMCDQHGYDQHAPPDPVAMPRRMCPVNEQMGYQLGYPAPVAELEVPAPADAPRAAGSSTDLW